jgi:hypothetical protein
MYLNRTESKREKLRKFPRKVPRKEGKAAMQVIVVLLMLAICQEKEGGEPCF